MPVLELTQKVKLRFANKTVGFRRHYAAMQAGERITRVVKVPGPPISAPGDAARIAGDPDTLYFVTLVQPIAGSSPPVTELTLDEAEPNGARVVEATPPAEAGAPSEKGPG
jgi:hypothetical protein